MATETVLSPKVLKKATEAFQGSDTKRSIWQIVNSVIPYLVLFYLMLRSLEISFWITLLLAFPTAGFMVRTFIIFHDACHGSFFRSPKANRAIGIITGLLTFTPYEHWKHNHALHHATAGDLDRRGVGDVMTLTVDEFWALPPLKRLGYRLFRNPLVMFGIGPTFMFMIAHRFASRKDGKREWLSVMWTNLALIGIVVGMSLLFGFREYVIVQMLVMVIGGASGVWLFYVQHNFEGSYWVRHEQWDFAKAGLQGSSFYKLPKILQWFTGNIGFHHIHHINPRVPNYKLEACQNANPIFQAVKPLTIRSSLRSLSLRLWDEKTGKMVGFRQAANTAKTLS
ncbi:MAG: fatty acid desaturase [Anaerolineales bacterium]|nr:fatty acid desaturase [Anaerolineales bacterium]